MLLTLDTATQFASIALYDGEWVLAELNWRTARRHTVELAPQVDNLLALADVTPEQITALAVSIGPGSYTGTRIALSYAKGVALARNLPLIGVPTLDILVYPHLPVLEPVCAMVAAGRGRYAWALYDTGDRIGDKYFPRRYTKYQINNIAEILLQLEPPIMFVGEVDARGRRDIRQAWEEDWIDLISPALAVRRGGALAELAWQRLQAGDVDDPVSLSPIYLR